MQKITLFYLEDCPYCKFAKRAVKELNAENKAYNAVEIDWVEESRRPEISEKYDYYYVPTIFCGNEKLYEASPSEKYEDCKRNIKNALDRVINGTV